MTTTSAGSSPTITSKQIWIVIIIIGAAIAILTIVTIAYSVSGQMEKQKQNDINMLYQEDDPLTEENETATCVLCIIHNE
jgi:flagellar basal body-associated protein FliL